MNHNTEKMLKAALAVALLTTGVALYEESILHYEVLLNRINKAAGGQLERFEPLANEKPIELFEIIDGYNNAPDPRIQPPDGQ